MLFSIFFSIPLALCLKCLFVLVPVVVTVAVPVAAAAAAAAAAVVVVVGRTFYNRPVKGRLHGPVEPKTMDPLTQSFFEDLETVYVVVSQKFHI